MSMEQVIKFDLFRTSVFETEMVDTWLSSWRHCTLEKCSTLYEASAFKEIITEYRRGDVPIVPLK